MVTSDFLYPAEGTLCMFVWFNSLPALIWCFPVAMLIYLVIKLNVFYSNIMRLYNKCYIKTKQIELAGASALWTLNKPISLVQSEFSHIISTDKAASTSVGRFLWVICFHPAKKICNHDDLEKWKNTFSRDQFAQSMCALWIWLWD